MPHREDARTNSGADDRNAPPADGGGAAPNAREAWAAFRAKYARSVRRYFERDPQLRAAADEIRRMVEDVLNEGFALTWPTAPDDHRVQSVLQRLEREAARESKRRVRREVPLEEIGELSERLYVDLLATTERDERLAWLERRLNKLSARDRLVIEGRLDGNSEGEIARELGCAVPSVQRRRHRVLERLRREARMLPTCPDRKS